VWLFIVAGSRGPERGIQLRQVAVEPLGRKFAPSVFLEVVGERAERPSASHSSKRTVLEPSSTRRHASSTHAESSEPNLRSKECVADEPAVARHDVPARSL